MSYKKTLFNFLTSTPWIWFLGIFLALLPLSISVKFQHNDDWVYYISVQNFLNGNLTLHPYIAATTYTQTVLGFLFSKLFGISNLPILTLFISILASYILFLILNLRHQIKKIDSFLISLLLLFNGLFVFTSMGFMTDNYFILFLLLSFYFFSNEKDSKLSFLFGVVFTVICYFTRQTGLLIPLAFGINLLLSKKYKKAFYFLAFFGLLSIYHFVFFHPSTESLEIKPIINNLFYPKYIYALFSVIVFYLFYFLLPILFPTIEKNKPKIIKMGLIVIGFLIINFLIFKPTNWVIKDGLGLRYTYTINGFFIENIKGTVNKSGYVREFYMIYKQLIYIVIGLFLGSIIIYKKYKVNLNSYLVFLLLYLISLVAVEKVYDRYLIPLIPITILIICQKNYAFTEFRRKFLIIFLIINLYLNYNFVMDYLQINNYVWLKSEKLVSEGVDPNQIVATDSWSYLYPRENKIYRFSHTSHEKMNSENILLIEKYTTNFPLQFLKKEIYLYKTKELND